jgi:hypothetical protein
MEFVWAYAGLGKPSEWLECDSILRLGGGCKEEQRRNYREYVESAVRGGLTASPWEQLREQVILGGREFLEKLRGFVRGNAREQRGAGRLAHKRPELNEIIANLEKARGEPWTEIRDRHGDSGRDLVLYLGRRVCGLKLGELAVLMEMKDYGAVSAAIRRYEGRLNRSRTERNCLRQLCDMSHIQM